VNEFVDLTPVERFENGSDMCGFTSLNNSTSKRVLHLLEPYCTSWNDKVQTMCSLSTCINREG